MQIIITDPTGALFFVTTLFFLILMSIFFMRPVARYIIKKIVNEAKAIILSDKYSQNLAELLPSLKRYSVLNVIEMSLRAETGKIIMRPLGTPRHFPGFENLMFSPRQMTGLSLPEGTPIDMCVTIGPQAAKPLMINIPLMISAMAYGLALSQEAKVALAQASNTLQTAICSGEGPLLPEEQEIADKHILQISRWSWGEGPFNKLNLRLCWKCKWGKGRIWAHFALRPRNWQAERGFSAD